MRRLLCLLACLGLPLLAPAADGPGFDREGYQKAIETIRCDCGCHPQSVKDCACGRGAEMREEIRAMMDGSPSATGGGTLTGLEVIAHYVAEQGEQILLSPKARGFNLVVWLGPLLGLVAAGFGMIWVLRSWKRQADPLPAGVPTASIPADDPYLARLRKDLQELE